MSLFSTFHERPLDLVTRPEPHYNSLCRSDPFPYGRGFLRSAERDWSVFYLPLDFLLAFAIAGVTKIT